MPAFPPHRPAAGSAYTRAHALGNDYLVVEEGERWTMSVEAVRRVCHRWEGVGSDGVIIVLGSPAAPEAPGPDPSLFRARMFNPDGSEFERSGNGLRILAAHLLGAGRVGWGEPFRVEVGGDRVTMEVHGRVPDGALDVSVDMGRARTGPGAVACDPSALESDPAGDAHGLLRLDAVQEALPLHLVSVGNPHAVHFAGESLFHREGLARVGPGVATHPAFARGTNVQLARMAGRGRAVDVLIWERGVGHTTGSGTSACAVAVAAVASGRLEPGPVELRMEGGTLHVTVTAELDVTLRGPVHPVCEGHLAEAFLEALRRG
ncbi:MAG TPA: diaminopimelate epimerase [Longimicrobiales bacterium]|jgi:diaminopimelate epimerase